MSKEVDRGKVFRQCKSKKRYRDEKQARAVMKRRSREVGYLDYYYCVYCNGWHLTSKEPMMKGRIK